LDHPVPTPELPPPIDAGASPLIPEHLVDLFLRPTRFFTSQLALGKTPYVVLVTLCLGISSVQDQIDAPSIELISRSFGGSGAFVQSWWTFWAVVLVLGSVSGLLQWWVGGWWCRVRLGWSGARAPDPHRARLLFVYSSFVYTAPSVLVLIAYTILYPSYGAAYEAELGLEVGVLLFVFWSVVTTYRGALSLFDVDHGRARLWFLILPAGFYLLSFGALGAVIALGAAAP